MICTQSDAPLSGLRVVEVGQAISAAFAAALFADLGADVVKVEQPDGDLLRCAGPEKDSVPLWWKATNRNKTLVSIDLKTAAGMDTFRRLMEPADVLVENFVPGTWDRLGLPLSQLREQHPRLVVASITAYGQTGPKSSLKGFARVVEAFSGLTYITGDPEGPPTHTGLPLADYISGLFGALGALASLRRRDVFNAGAEHVDVAMSEAVLRLLEHQVVSFSELALVSERAGNNQQTQAGAGIFRTRDGRWVSVTGGPHDQMVMRLLDLAAVPRTVGVDDLSGNKMRLKHRDAIHAGLQRWAASRTADELCALGAKAGIPIAPVNSMADVFADEQIQARRSIVRVSDPDLGSVGLCATVPRIFGCEDKRIRAAELHAADIDAVIQGWAGSPPKKSRGSHQ